MASVLNRWEPARDSPHALAPPDGASPAGGDRAGAEGSGDDPSVSELRGAAWGMEMKLLWRRT